MPDLAQQLKNPAIAKAYQEQVKPRVATCDAVSDHEKNLLVQTVVEKPLTIQAVRSKPALNHTEARFLMILQLRHPAPAIVRVQPYRFQLGYKCSYLPDFAVICAPHKITMYETKGAFIRDDGIAKFKIAARMFPEFQWVLAQWLKTGWKEEVFS